ncbi:hypothetical protein NQZ68_019862, partial [Dissostichus eleginoides]
MHPGARGSVVWVHACFIVFLACHFYNGMKDVLLGEVGEGGNRNSWMPCLDILMVIDFLRRGERIGSPFTERAQQRPKSSMAVSGIDARLALREGLEGPDGSPLLKSQQNASCVSECEEPAGCRLATVHVETHFAN